MNNKGLIKMALSKGTMLRIKEGNGFQKNALAVLTNDKKENYEWIHFRYTHRLYKIYEDEIYTLHHSPYWEIAQSSKLFTDKEYEEIFI